MLWSLVRILAFVAVVAGLALGAGYLVETGTAIRIEIGNTEYTLGPLQAVIAALVLIGAIWLALKLTGFVLAVFRLLNGDETAISRYFSRAREKKGYRALGEGLLALASGEGRTALARALRAERYLKQPELTNLLVAQAAEQVGDRRKATEVYKALLRDDKTRFVGVRGLLRQKLEEGDTETALLLAKKAFVLKPRQEEIHDTLLRLQAEKRDWTGARETLSAKMKSGALPRDVYRRRDAVLALSEARDILAQGKSIEAREEAIEANRLSPDLVPAAVMAAQAYLEENRPRLATRILRKAWSVRPHPDLAAAFAAIRPDETPEERLKRFRSLIRMHPDQPVTRMLLAELHVAAKEYPEARKALGNLVETDPTTRALSLMAAIERGEGSPDSVVRAWLAKALAAPRGPQWVCDNCQTVHADWAPVCENCGSFDSLSWRKPVESVQALSDSAGMLPLLVGADENGEAVADQDEPKEMNTDTSPEETDTSAGEPGESEKPGPVLEGEVVALGGDGESKK